MTPVVGIGFAVGLTVAGAASAATEAAPPTSTSPPAQDADASVEEVRASPEELPADVQEILQDWEGVEDVEDLSLADLLDMPVSGASRFEQRQSEVPSAATVITAAELRMYGWRTLSDLLRSLRGVYVSSDRNYEYLGVRGFGIPGDYNTRLLVLIDGHRLNDGVYDSTDPGNAFPLDLADIERVELIRGPASSVYGANAFFGVVNVITRLGRTRPGVGVEARVGNWGTGVGHVSYGQRFENELEIAGAFSIGRSEGEREIYFPEFDDPSTNDGVAEGRDGEEFMRGFASAHWKGVSAVANMGFRNKQVPTAAFGTAFNAPGNANSDLFGVFGLGYDADFGDGWALAAHLTYNHYEFRGEYPYEYEGPEGPLTVNRDVTLGNWVGADAQVQKAFLEHFKASLGCEFRYLLDADQQNFDESPDGPVVYLDTADEGWVLGTYVQGQARLFEDVLTLDAGVRFDAFHVDHPSDDFQVTQIEWSPRAAVIVRPGDTTVLRAIYGSAFRAANAYERFYTFGVPEDGGAQLFNPSLRAERIQTVEVVAEQYLGPNVRVLAAGYYYAIENLIALEVIDDLDNTRFENQGSAQAMGLEAEIEAKLPGALRARGSYGLQQASNAAGEPLTNSPTHLGKLNLAVPLVSERLWLAFEVQYMSERLTVNQTDSAGAHVLTHASVYGQGFVEGLSFTASVRNLLDWPQFDPGSVDHDQSTLPQRGRTFWLGVRYDLDVFSGLAH